MCQEQRIEPQEELQQAVEEVRALPVAINGLSWEEHLRRVAAGQVDLVRVGGHLVPQARQ